MNRGQFRLTLVCIDVATEEPVADCLDSWFCADLLGEVCIVDLSDESSNKSWLTSYPNDPNWVSLNDVFASKPWESITLVSCRTDTLGKVSEQRVRNEERIRSSIIQSYPVGGGVQTRFVTLSIVDASETKKDANLPIGFTVNLLHESKIISDSNMPIIAVSESNRIPTLAFMSIVAAGGFRSQTNGPIDALNDYEPGLERNIRLCRAIGRAGSGGLLLDENLRRVIGSSNRGTVSVPNLYIAEFDQNRVGKLAAEIIEQGKFSYKKYESKKNEDPKPIGIFRAVAMFFGDIKFYLIEATKRTVESEVKKRTQGILDLADGKLFGDAGGLVIKGSSRDAPSSEIVNEVLTYLKQIDSNIQVDTPTSNPKQWDFLIENMFSLIDAGDSRHKVKSLSTSTDGPVVFRDPLVVGPLTSHSRFTFRPSEVAKFSIPEALIEVDILDRRNLVRVSEFLREAKERALFDTSTVTQVEQVATPFVSRLKGSLSRADRIRERMESGVLWDDGEPEPVLPARSASDLRKAFIEWQSVADKESQQSLLWQIAKRIDDDVLQAKQDQKLDDIRKELEELSKLDEPRMGALGKVLAVSGLLATLVILGKTFLAFMAGIAWIFIGIFWLFSTVIAIATRIFLLALEIRRYQFQKDQIETAMTQKMNTTLIAISEYFRLQLVQMQFEDWHRVIREVVHSPYGRIKRVADTETSLKNVPRPPQFAIAELQPSDQQKIRIQHELSGRILSKGYLSEVFNALMSNWQQSYDELQPNSPNRTPEADITEKNVIGGLARPNGSPIFNARVDFRSQLEGPSLRESNTFKIVESLIGWLRNQEIRTIFSNVVGVSSGAHALEHKKPEDYLYEFLRSDQYAKPIEFSSDLFSPLGAEYAGANFEGRDSSPIVSNMDSVDIEAGRSLVLMTHSFDYSKKIPLKMFKGYSKGAQGQPGPTGEGGSAAPRT